MTGAAAAVVRLARADEDLPGLQTIESAGDRLFVEWEMAGVERWLPSPLDDLVEARDLGRLWVVEVGGEAAGSARTVVGFARTEELDGQAHLEQLSVDPAHMRRGFGSALVEAVCRDEKARGRTVVTLTTFADVPWNAPFYAARGFAVVGPADWGPEMQERRDGERRAGLDTAPRVVMARRV